jgi:hypothetical protein
MIPPAPYFGQIIYVVQYLHFHSIPYPSVLFFWLLAGHEKKNYSRGWRGATGLC